MTSSDRRAAGQDISALEERLAEEAKQLREAAELLHLCPFGIAPYRSANDALVAFLQISKQEPALQSNEALRAPLSRSLA